MTRLDLVEIRESISDVERPVLGRGTGGRHGGWASVGATELDPVLGVLSVTIG